jgi:hypothetical protein
MLNGFQNPRMIKLIVISGTVNYDDWGVSDEISLHLDFRCFIAVSFFQVERFIDSLFDHIP